jgi:putative oxidoreductase
VWWAIHWWFKVGVSGMPATEAFFISLGVPAWLAWFDVCFEVVVAICLLSGVFFRLACLTSLPILIAGMIVYRKGGFYFPNGGIELPILWALVQISLVLIGPGPLSLNSPVRARKGLLGWLLL